MWTISGVKEQAKRILNKHYFNVFLISLAVTITGGNNSGANSRLNINNSGGFKFHFDFFSFNSIRVTRVLLIAIAFAIFRAFIGYVIEVGAKRFFIDTSKGDCDIGKVGYGFKSGYYVNIFLTMLYRALIIFLHILLLIIPGIIKAYSYRFVPFILADNPSLSSSRALEISERMTMGEKMELFIFDLSFIGWYILAAILTFGFGVLFVQPYYDMSLTEVYNELKLKSVQAGEVDYAELSFQEY